MATTNSDLTPSVDLPASVVISPFQKSFDVSGPNSREGFSATARGEVNRTVYRISSDTTLAPFDGSIVLVDASSDNVKLTVDTIPAGTKFTVIAEDASNVIDIDGVSALNVISEGATNELDGDGAVAEVIHPEGGDLYLHGNSFSGTAGT